MPPTWSRRRCRDHAGNKTTISMLGDRHQPAVQLPAIFLDGAAAPRERSHSRAAGSNSLPPRTRSRRPWRSSRPMRSSARPLRRRARKRQGSGFDDRLRQGLSAGHDRLRCRSCARCRRPTPTSSSSVAYPPDTVGIMRAANEIGLNAKMFGGAMIGLLVTPDQGAARPAGERPRHHARASCRLRRSISRASSAILSNAIRPRRRH